MAQQSTWTEEEVELLKRRWPEVSAPVLALELGRTRNAIIGKADRLGLIKPPLPGRQAKPRKRRRKAKAASLPAPQREDRSVSILKVGRLQCRAIIGTTDDEWSLALCCGQTVNVASRFMFCNDHLAIYTNKVRSAS